MEIPTQSLGKRGRQTRRAPAPKRGQRIVGAVGRHTWFAAKIVIPLVLLLTVGVGLLYVRLLNGPISLRFLAEPIGRSIAAEMPGVGVEIGDALVRLTDAGRIEFRMRNVRFSDADGAPIAVAPLAAVGVSPAGLLSGRLAPDRVVLIEPRVLVVVSESGGVSIGFSKPAEGEARASTETAATAPPVPPAGTPADPLRLQTIDVARLLSDAGRRARSGGDAASYLRSVGVRNATVIIDRTGRQSVLTVSEADIDLEHKKKRSSVAGKLKLTATTGPWELDFKIDEAEKTNSVALAANIRDLVPRGLAATFPDLAGLDVLDAPLSGEARIELHPNGLFGAGKLDLELGRGALTLPGEGHSIGVDGGRLDLAFDPQARRLSIGPSSIRWQGGEAKGEGSVSAVGGTDRPLWAIDLKVTEGRLSGEEFGVPSVPIEGGTASGLYATDSGQLVVSQAQLKAGGAQVDVSGELQLAADTQTVKLDGRISPASAEVVKAVWPRFIGPGARRWVGRQVSRGRIGNASFKADLTISRGVVVPDKRKVSMALEASDVAFVPGRNLAAVEVPRAQLRIEGDGMEITIPEALCTLSGNRRVVMKPGRFTAVALYDEPTLGEIAFRYQAGLPAAVEYLEQEGLGIGSLGLPQEGLDGKVEGNIKINLPLVAGVQLSDMKIEGKARIADGRVKQIIGPHDVAGATINVDVGEGAINAAGQMLIGGVHAKLAFQRFLDATPDRQPPLRVTATLDASDRNQLGLDVNNIVNGDVPVDLAVSRADNGETQMKLRADLSSAEIFLEPVAWRKPPGRQAQLEFDVVKGPKGRTELQNVKAVGDDIAVDGTMAIDGKGRLVEFNFPNFALTLVSRLELQGALRADNVWDVKARGGYWDGRDYFRQLFSIGAGPERQAPVRKDQPGLDLKAEIDTVQGHSDIALKGLRVQASRRGQRLVGLIARGVVEGGKPIEVGMQQTANEPRKLVVLTDDAGQAFRMVGFYPNLQGGQMRLDINLDGKGAAEKTGRLDVHNFKILGDTVVSEVLQTPDQARRNEEAGVRPRRKLERQSIDFWLMQAPFLVGYNQFVLENAQLRGPLLGASLVGKADFKLQQVDIVGTYAPLQGVNAMLNDVPLMGPLLNGPRGEGIVGINFHIAGPMSQPQVMVNPLSLVLPGSLRGLTELTPNTYRIIPRDEKPPAPPRLKPQNSTGGEAVRSQQNRQRSGRPEMSSEWSTSTSQGKN